MLWAILIAVLAMLTGYVLGVVYAAQTKVMVGRVVFRIKLTGLALHYIKNINIQGTMYRNYNCHPDDKPIYMRHIGNYLLVIPEPYYWRYRIYVYKQGEKCDIRLKDILKVERGEYL